MPTWPAATPAALSRRPMPPTGSRSGPARCHPGAAARPVGAHRRRHRARGGPPRAAPKAAGPPAPDSPLGMLGGDRRHRRRARGDGALGRLARPAPGAGFARPALGSHRPVTAAATPMTVTAGDVHWVATLGDGMHAYNSRPSSRSARSGDQPDCAALVGQTFERLNLDAAPDDHRSPTDGQAIVVGQDCRRPSTSLRHLAAEGGGRVAATEGHTEAHTEAHADRIRHRVSPRDRQRSGEPEPDAGTSAPPSTSPAATRRSADRRPTPTAEPTARPRPARPTPVPSPSESPRRPPKPRSRTTSRSRAA